jgi:hypothetical protein
MVEADKSIRYKALDLPGVQHGRVSDTIISHRDKTNQGGYDL